MERVKLDHCSDADRDHERRPRAYTHVGHHAGTICLSNAIVFLPREFVLGILLHELGHLTASNSEWKEYRTGGALAGIRIRRKTHRGHGIASNLEWIAPRDVPQAIETLKRFTNL